MLAFNLKLSRHQEAELETQLVGAEAKGDLSEVKRVLKPGGVVVLTFYYRFSLHWFSQIFLYRPLLPLILLLKRKPLRDCLLHYKAEPLPFSYRKFKKVFIEIGFKDLEVQHSGFTIFPINRLFPRLSTYSLKLESAFFNSNILGWLGSICIVKGIKKSESRGCL